MATMAALLGGVLGFFSFVWMLVFSDAGFGAALQTYLMVGMGTTLSLICLGLMAPRSAEEPRHNRLQPAPAQTTGTNRIPAE
ncbi:hypothetical protein [uncultured Roseobacter sp.]|uniref:hypothetical protein n=1 Tax=uncultured Roseobacter sp. TaxID=114847 RepID=UPI0026054B84|nr:hypothetical protein [uncultured Roseobacter sp.]